MTISRNYTGQTWRPDMIQVNMMSLYDTGQYDIVEVSMNRSIRTL